MGAPRYVVSAGGLKSDTFDAWSLQAPPLCLANRYRGARYQPRSSSPATTTPSSASSIRASTNSGRSRHGHIRRRQIDPRYTPSTTFETFPFPEGLTPDIPAADYADDPRAQAIAAAAARLNELRENWLNPPDLVVREPEVVPGYPERILPKDEEAAKELKKRTLTNSTTRGRMAGERARRAR